MNQHEYVMATRGETFTPPIDIARDWVMDVVADPELVEGASDAAVRRFIERQYEGGWKAFLEECC